MQQENVDAVILLTGEQKLAVFLDILLEIIDEFKVIVSSERHILLY